ncbi:MAG: efflux RND transporter periplasmic adaptor subunit [Burkholderiales bacterium]|jgi:membrane fusion protein (multidrug efflux system)
MRLRLHLSIAAGLVAQACCMTGVWAQSTVAADPAAAALPGLPRLERQELRAQLTPRRYTTIAAEIGARVRSLPVVESGAFKSGQVLVAFDCSVQQAQRDKAQAEYEAAQASLKANERMSELNAVGQLELDLSRSSLKRAKAELDGQQALIDKCTIVAPFNGRVADQKVREQQFVQPGQPLLDILDDTALELEFLVPSAWLRWLKPGLPLRVVIDETRKTYPARFTRIGAKVDPVSQSVKVAATIDGSFPELIAGMSGRVMASAP